MEENQKTETTVDTETSVKPEQHIKNVGNQKKKPFKKKNFNGHLRNNNNKEKFHHPKDDEHEVDTSTSNPKPIYSDLFYFLRQKFFYNNAIFFETLDNVLKTLDIKDIKEGNMNLFSYSAMYEKNEIFMELSEKFPNQINSQDFEKYIIPVCLNKNEETLESVIEVFNKNIPLQNEFMMGIMAKMAKMSYRDNNNTLILNWFTHKLDNDLCKTFWSLTFEEKNISLAITALKNPILKNYLKENFDHFINSVEKMGKLIEITRKLNISEPSKTMTEKPLSIINTVDEPNFYLSDKEEQIQHLTKEDVTTKVTIKRRKIAA